MKPYSAHIGYLYSELPFAERIGAAAKDGFTAIEHPEPFDLPAYEMRVRLDDAGLSFSQLSSGMGDVARGEKGIAALRGREAEFRTAFLRAVEYAHEVGCRFVHPMAGVPSGGLLDACETYHANLGWAIEACYGSGVAVLLEAITAPGYHLASLTEAVALHDRFGQRFKILFDTYHAAVLHIDAVKWIDKHADRIGHVHIADHPRRHQPGTGTIDFPEILQSLDRSGYRGAIGFEYQPTASTHESIGFLKTWRHEAEPAARSSIHSGAVS
ncbi:hydroxypyruvate isomerase family protein [Agrobacterium tumefaciens]|uniref:TIM barrel protein n=1 Tax=Agrobacterium tumefaciens TaxID=358 RepID=A0AA44F5C9_AGRTU|nr:TIM barrel protein [Agrobacterium tumefaciens]NTB87561.1 TIM barrel protein [Agrobacterium tumefaciens]NTC19744.1 TIM barrel protein [Agrobacterium tumefaciens]NTC29672.1 TIM barrel protein [Agrobacterium tumefaciens]